jgi:hypothetical protein
MPPWEQAILASGAQQMIHLRNLMLSRPYLTRIPAQELLTNVKVTPALGNIEEDRFNPLRASHPRATRCVEGAYAMIYFPLGGQSLQVDLGALAGQVKAWWYDPRDGKSYSAGEQFQDIVTFTSPIAGPDWVLGLDSAEQDFSEPG